MRLEPLLATMETRGHSPLDWDSLEATAVLHAIALEVAVFRRRRRRPNPRVGIWTIRALT